MTTGDGTDGAFVQELGAAPGASAASVVAVGGAPIASTADTVPMTVCDRAHVIVQNMIRGTITAP